MFKASHIEIANSVLDKIQPMINWKINKNAYLFGSIAPDINFIYPTHTLGHTIKRFRNKITRMDKADSNTIRSFTLGVITHYICDYFCYAHNLEHNNPKHAIYERILRVHIKEQEENLKWFGDKLNDQWNEIKLHIAESMAESNNIEDIIHSISTKGADHIEYVMETVEYMHNEYMDKTNNTDRYNWSKSVKKIRLDIEYSTFMCEKIALLILNPDEELMCLV